MLTRLAPAARPRERLFRLGPGLLPDQELIALVVGQGVRGQDALQVAQDLQQRVGTVAETLSRAFAKLKAAGAIDVRGSQITIRNRAALAALADE